MFHLIGVILIKIVFCLLEHNSSNLGFSKNTFDRFKAHAIVKNLKEKISKRPEGSIADIDNSKATLEKQEQIERFKVLNKKNIFRKK